MKLRHQRTVFGRRRAKVDRVTYVVEMQEEKIRMKPLGGMVWQERPLDALVRSMLPQPELELK